jgi:hypothetical protein
MPGISAVLTAPVREDALLDLVAVLDGLVGGNFDITVVGTTRHAVECIQASRPNLPLRHSTDGLTAAISGSQRDLILLASGTGELDVYELNHFLEAIEHGADLAIGYRPMTLERAVNNALGTLLFGKTARDVDCPFKLFRRSVWERTSLEPHGVDRWFSMRLIVRTRRFGFRIAEVPVRLTRTILHQTDATGAPETEHASRVA